MHAEQAEAEPNKSSVARMKKQIVFLDKQEQEIKAEIKELSWQNQKVKELIKKIESLPGVGLLTAVTVLAETNGFELIRNKRQLASYAGLDVKEKQSGTSVKGKPRISKKGNKYLRKAVRTAQYCHPAGTPLMKIATYKDGSRDGQLIVVSRDLASAHFATGIATRLQQLLDDWNFLSPQLEDLYATLNDGKARACLRLRCPPVHGPPAAGLPVGGRIGLCEPRGAGPPRPQCRDARELLHRSADVPGWQ